MDFESFLELISNIDAMELGGLKSQFKMVPEQRRFVSQLNMDNLSPKKAAVLALFYPNRNNETCFLLTLRSSYKGVHSKQISFPGGKFEKVDKTLKYTALRETYEEVGIESKDIIVKKKLTDTFIPPSNFLVSPFLGIKLHTPKFRFNHEVEKVIEVKLTDLLLEETVTSKKMSTSYMNNIYVPYYKLNSYTVWGATAMMLSEFKSLLKGM